jgi:Phage head-tail joining protein
MALIGAVGIARLKAALAHTLTASATIKRKTQVADNTGGFSDTYVTVATHLCSFSRAQITPIERENAVQVQAISFWNFVFAAGTDIRTTDRIVVSGRTFEVVSSATGSLELATRVVCQEIT